MKKISLVLLSLLLLQINTVKASDSQHLVVVVNFDCPHCQGLSEYIPLLDRSMRSNGVNLVFAPLPISMDKNLRELIYYRANMIERELGRKVLSTFFRLSKDDIAVTSLEDAITWLEIDFEDVDWERLITKDGLEKAKERIGRAGRLAVKAGVISFPSYISVRGFNVNQILVDGNASEQVMKLINKHSGGKE